MSERQMKLTGWDDTGNRITPPDSAKDKHAIQAYQPNNPCWLFYGEDGAYLFLISGSHGGGDGRTYFSIQESIYRALRNSQYGNTLDDSTPVWVIDKDSAALEVEMYQLGDWSEENRSTRHEPNEYIADWQSSVNRKRARTTSGNLNRGMLRAIDEEAKSLNVNHSLRQKVRSELDD